MGELSGGLLRFAATAQRRALGPFVRSIPLYVRRAQGHRFARQIPADNAYAVDHSSATSVAPSNPLEAYFDAHTTGRGIYKWRHYFEIYHRHLSKFVGQEVHIVEIGIYSGGSLQMWSEYLGPECHVYGVDIEETCTAYESEAVTIFIGDQASPSFWETFRRQVPLIDIVIDDGGHRASQQIATLEELLPHMRAGGVYLCEDIHRISNRFAAYLSSLVAHLNDAEFATPTGFQQMVQSVHHYPFAAVIEKPSKPVAPFTAPKHGTEWQPFDLPRVGRTDPTMEPTETVRRSDHDYLSTGWM